MLGRGLEEAKLTCVDRRTRQVVVKQALTTRVGGSSPCFPRTPRVGVGQRESFGRTGGVLPVRRYFAVIQRGKAARGRRPIDHEAGTYDAAPRD